MTDEKPISLTESSTCESGAFLSENMQNPESQEINKRFFAAIDELVKRKVIRGRKSFATKYELNWGNLHRLRVEPEREFQLSYLTWLVKDFGVSSQWLLTGEGEMFSKRVTQKTTGSSDPAVSKSN
jgi:hypothetical protein